MLSKNLLHQFYERHYFDHERVVQGLKLMLWGMFKKVVIADRLAIFVDQIYDHPHDYTGLWLILATLFFAFQIYCDFSGYSDIAIGAAGTMGFRLMKNFERPYFASSIAEFWRRWHISLSSWFRDYLYIPLGGNRVGPKRWYFNLFITFLLSGLWHGANWTYVIWGALNGFYLVAGTLYRRSVKNDLPLRHTKLGHIVSVLGTFALTCFGWIFFRARNIGDALHIVSNLFHDLRDQLGYVSRVLIQTAVHREGVSSQLIYGGKPVGSLNALLLSLALIGFLMAVQFLQRRGSLSEALSRQPLWIRWPVYFASVMAIGFLGEFHNTREFIHFQF